MAPRANLSTFEAMARKARASHSTATLSEEKKIGTKVVLLGYFNPPSLLAVTGETSIIAKVPSALPGETVGPIQELPGSRWNWGLNHSCYGIHGCSGSPVISAITNCAIGVFDSSTVQIHGCIAARTTKYQLRLWLQTARRPMKYQLRFMLQTATLRTLIRML
ncbi:hypothetical protein QOZ80_6AG0540290 [Eleusine coracana subsp. coracana]|nr:hypothetical protein QOZ80_6AG0540290 [Eleusine coracana subsp. coracana]